MYLHNYQVRDKGLFIRVLEIVQYPTYICLRINYFRYFAATMAWSGFGPYHGMWREYAQTKCIGVIPTPWAMTIALGLGVITPEPELYHAYGRAILRNFYFMS